MRAHGRIRMPIDGMETLCGGVLHCPLRRAVCDTRICRANRGCSTLTVCTVCIPYLYTLSGVPLMLHVIRLIFIFRNSGNGKDIWSGLGKEMVFGCKDGVRIFDISLWNANVMCFQYIIDYTPRQTHLKRVSQLTNNQLHHTRFLVALSHSHHGGHRVDSGAANHCTNRRNS